MAHKANKTEHCGAKKGSGAYWGPKEDAKHESSRLRRRRDLLTAHAIVRRTRDCCVVREWLTVDLETWPDDVDATRMERAPARSVGGPRLRVSAGVRSQEQPQSTATEEVK